MPDDFSDETELDFFSYFYKVRLVTHKMHETHPGFDYAEACRCFILQGTAAADEGHCAYVLVAAGLPFFCLAPM